ncbi:MAG: PQQ-dependent sugar dehydrogenase [Phycisphaerales bacterium]
MRVTLPTVFAVVGSMSAAATAGAQTGPLSATTTRVATGLTQPVMVTHAPGDRSRLFIVEKKGKIKILRDGAVLATPFLDIDPQVNDLGESGCLSMAFSPDYATSRAFYVFYTRQSVGGTVASGTVIARFYASAENPDVADAASEELVFFAARGAGNHNGGWLGFGADGLLYATVGEMGNSSLSQNLQSPHGKLLRINPSGDDFPADPNRNFTVPPSNPFVETPNALPEIFAFGLRNPWRASIDRDTGNLWIGDVGGGTAGEIDFIAGGSAGAQNFGWPCFDSANPLSNIANCGGNASLITQPVWAHSNYNLGRSITGGYVYRGCAIQAAKGLYFFADYTSGRIWTFPGSGATVATESVIERTDELRPGGGINFGAFSGFGDDADGELYLCNLNAGSIHKIVPAPGTFRDINANGIPDGCEAPFCGAADVGSLGGSARPDNQLTADDIVVYLAAFFAGDLTVADIAGLGGTLEGDGQLTPDDLVVFLDAFFAGCP